MFTTCKYHLGWACSLAPPAPPPVSHPHPPHSTPLQSPQQPQTPPATTYCHLVYIKNMIGQSSYKSYSKTDLNQCNRFHVKSKQYHVIQSKI